MSINNRLVFLTYDEQINQLKKQSLNIYSEEDAKHTLKNTSFYSLVHGYRDVFRSKETKNYKPEANFEGLFSLYSFDEKLRQILMKYILIIERKLKSIYSYHFCETFGDRQTDYQNINNYNYEQFGEDVTEFVGKYIKNALKSNKEYIKHHREKYNEVPLWVLVNALTFGNISFAYKCSKLSLKSKIAKEFESKIYSNQLDAMLNVLSKFRNVCAHNERLFMYHTQKSIVDLPIHKNLSANVGKNNIFAVCICFKYLLDRNEFISFLNALKDAIDEYLSDIDESIRTDIFIEMGLISDWEDSFKENIKVTNGYIK